MDQAAPWPYLPTLARLALALAIGLFVGIEREHRRKEAGLRTFAFAALLGAVGGLLGERFSLLALGLLGILVVLLNMETIHTGEGAEITTSAALLVTGFGGVLAGQGHTFTPTVLSVATAALLAWKEPLAGFSQALTQAELRSAVLLAILAFVVYPVLPTGTIDPWRLVDPKAAWVTVILIAGLGFANYMLLKLYGAGGIELTGFLGGLVNSTVTVTELATRAGNDQRLSELAYQGVLLATTAMLVRNAAILGFLSAAALVHSILPFTVMIIGTAALALLTRRQVELPPDWRKEPPLAAMESPFSLSAAVKFGTIFLGLQIAGTLAQRGLGHAGFYTVSLIGGCVSSASAVASAATLAASGSVSASVAGIGAILASLMSVLVNLPIVARLSHNRTLTRRIAWTLVTVVLLGAIGVLAQRSLDPLIVSMARTF
jgi:uncharacterized membrane protein (DUF4010 family)